MVQPHRQTAQILPAMDALGKHGENSARLALRLQRRDGNHRGKEDGVAGMPAQEKKYLIALRVNAINSRRFPST